MTSPAIRVCGLTKIFDGKPVVRDLSFEVARGTTVGLLGGNGAGKTTTLSMLLGLLLPSAGEIEMLGSDMRRHPERVLPRLNFSSPYVDLPHRLTVAENLKVYGMLYGVPDLSGRIAELCRDLDLGEFLHRRVGGLSSGQKTRVALAKALVNRPELLLLDEPTASLDPDTADWVRRYFQDYQRRTGATLLLASHNMTEVERLCDHIFVMRRGVLVDEGGPDHLIARYGRANLEEVFLDIARDRTPAA